MYSSFLVGKGSHKDVKESSNWLFKLYYGNRMLMAYCCVGCEVLYIALFLISKNHTEDLMDVVVTTLKVGSPLSVLVGVSLFGCSVKQIINIIQMKTAADSCVLLRNWKKKKQKP